MTGGARRKIVALCGGIGGAKLAQGLLSVLDPSDLTLIVNTGDDFRHFGLHVSPDIDTVTYTLTGRANTLTGWGRADESWRFLEAVRALGGPDWFGLGDTDLATKAVRSQILAEGGTLTMATRQIAAALGLDCALIPATDDPIPTIIETGSGDLAFQHYFVRERWQPAVRGLRYEGASQARLSPEVRRALADPALAGVVICPSNPWLSIGPMLAVPGMTDALTAAAVPVVAVAPLVAGEALKGPLAKMMAELGLEPGLQAIADFYGGLLDVLIADDADRGAVVSGPDLRFAPTVMRNADDRAALARVVLALVAEGAGR